MLENVSNFEDCTVKEFFVFLDDKKKELKLQNDIMEKDFIVYKNCFDYIESRDCVLCNRNMVNKMVSTTNGKKTYAKILENVFGPKFFKLNKEEMEEYKNNGIYTKDQFYDMISPIIGNKNGVSINLPQSYEDLVDLIASCLEVVCNDNIHTKVKEAYSMVYCTIEQIIGVNFKNKTKEVLENKYIIDCINTIISLVKAKKQVKYDNKFIEALDKKMYQINNYDDGRVDYVCCEFGKTTAMFIDKHNEEIKHLEKEKELKSRTNKYYKKLTKTKLENLSNDDFPSYADEDVVEIYRSLINKLNEASDKKHALYDIRAITELMYAGYFGSEYYDEEKVFGKNK